MGHLWASEYSGNTTLTFLQQLSAKTPQVPRPMLGQMSKEPRGCQDHREKLRLGWGEWSASRPGICPQSCPAGAPLQLHSWSAHSPLPSRRALRATRGPGSAAGRERRTRGRGQGRVVDSGLCCRGARRPGTRPLAHLLSFPRGQGRPRTPSPHTRGQAEAGASLSPLPPGAAGRPLRSWWARSVQAPGGRALRLSWRPPVEAPAQPEVQAAAALPSQVHAGSGVRCGHVSHKRVLPCVHRWGTRAF